MERILFIRALILCPLLLIFACISIMLLARWIDKKKISLKSKAISVTVIVCTILCGYFMFIHGNLRKTVIDLDACTRSFDEILALDAEKQDNPYFGSDNGEHYCTDIKDGNLDIKIHIIYGSMNPWFDVTKTSSNTFEALFSPLFVREKKDGDILCTASAMRASKEAWLFDVQAFNGYYHGSIHMRKDDVNIIIDYTVSNEQKLYYAFTTEKPDKVDIAKYLP